MGSIFYGQQVDVECNDCDKVYEDLWAQVSGEYICWTCPDCGYEKEQAVR